MQDVKFNDVETKKTLISDKEDLENEKEKGIKLIQQLSFI